MTGALRIRADRVRATESLYGPARAERPTDLRGGMTVCPFCPGNEHLTGPALTRDDGVEWTTRVVANRYPAVVEPDGRHEVIVETREHTAVWPALDAPALEAVLRVYRDREVANYAAGYAYVTVFKNAGAAAGASLRHPHAQVVALRAIPASVRVRLERITRECATCSAIDAAAAVVARTPDAVAYIPDGARTAFEVRIAPAAHASRFACCSEVTLRAAAALLHDAVKRLAALLGEELAFNMIVQSAPRDARAESLVHWELELVPRSENFGGFEIGTGGFLVSRTPEDAAALLRAAGGGFADA